MFRWWVSMLEFSLTTFLSLALCILPWFLGANAYADETVNMSCSEMVSKYGPGAEAQSKRPDFLEKYNGKIVNWSGTLLRVNETLWGDEAEVLCTKSSGRAEVTLGLEQSAKGEMPKLKPGQQINFSGEIDGLSEDGGIIIRQGKLLEGRAVEPPKPVAQGKPAPAPRTPVTTSQKTWREPVTGMEFVWAPGGCFQMGCGTWSEECAKSELPVHEVCVSGFWIGKYEVTQEQWKRVMGSNPSGFQGEEDHPVEMVSWLNAKEFIAKLNAANAGSKFRLPTESEWEFACRSGGCAELYSGGRDLNSLGWFDTNAAGTSQPVGTKSPNGLGLFDMSGNVWEWCEDIYDPVAYQHYPRNNPLWQRGGSEHVIRGGCWYGSSKGARCSSRYSYPVTKTRSDVGFRLVAIVE